MDIPWVDIVWTDLVGRSHVLRATREACQAGELGVSRARLLAGFGSEDGPAEGSPLQLRPDWSSERALPWDEGVSVCVADLYEDGHPSPLCVRSFLKDARSQADQAGYEVRAAVELEFHLVNPDTGRPIYDRIDNYGLSRVEAEPVITALRNDMRAMAIGVEASNPEYGGGQFEVNLSHAELLAAADQAVLVRLFTGVIADRFGVNATYMSKPWSEYSSSGIHVHQSLWRGGHNVFFAGPDELSDTGKAYLAGLLDSVVELAMLGSPTPNGFHRRTGGSFAPTVVAWATDNRTTVVRAIHGGEGATRIEHRDGGADCNLYLTMGAQVLAGMDGIARGATPPPPVAGNAYEDGLPLLPRTFVEAYDRLRGSSLAARLLPAALLHAYLDVLAPEYAMAIESAADWERARYAEVPLR